MLTEKDVDRESCCQYDGQPSGPGGEAALRMQQTFLFPITGLYNECHDVDSVALRTASPPRADESHGLRRLNDLWWREALAPSALDDLIARLQRHVGVGGVEIPIAWEAVVADPDKFIAELTAASERLVDLGAGPRSAFRALETLSIFTDLHSTLISHPFELSLQEGYVVNELSSLDLARAALDPARNPYLTFLERMAFPYLETRATDVAWLVGRIKLTTFSMAAYLRSINPNVHISVVGHSSEYYSLNKIAKYLRTNGILFSYIDSIVLDDFDNTPRLLREALAAGDDLESVPNLMYRHGDEIRQTGYVVQQRDLRADLRVPPTRAEYANFEAPSSVVAETRLWPSAQCYWNGCNFCAINRRYNTLPRNSFVGEDERAAMMTELAQNGVRYLWSVDEAIPPPNLGHLAESLVALGAPISWETRSKIDRNFTDDICSRLGKSGLVEIRLGLESANPRVLSSMGKYADGWSLDLVERIVASFHKAGVSVHFPTIIGYPGETPDERRDTYDFLEHLIARFPSVTFNINLLGFDVASKLFEEYEKFGITTIRWPAPTKYFLGNLIDWDCQETPFNYDTLDAERNQFMRRVLYPWMPESASVPPYIFYRLTETSRATMVWKHQRAVRGAWREPDLTVDLSQAIVAADSLILMGPFNRGRFDPGVHYTCYSWSTHQIFECDELTYSLLQQLTTARPVGSLDGPLPVLKRIAEALGQVGAVVNADAGTASRATFAAAPTRWNGLASEAARPNTKSERNLPTLVRLDT